MINATLKWMVTYWQEGFKKRGYWQSIILEIKKAQSLIFKGLLLKLWIIHTPYTVFLYKTNRGRWRRIELPGKLDR